MSIARHHHYVPQFYLKGFADGVGRKARVFAADLSTGDTYKSRVRNVAGKRDFNRVKIEGVDPNAYESAYGLFEDEAAPALKDVISARAFPSPRHFSIVINLLAVLSVRHPRVRANMHDGMARMYDMMSKMLLSSKERWERVNADMVAKGYVPRNHDVSYEEVKTFSDSGEYDIVIEQTYFVQQEVRMVDAVLPWLARRRWSFKIATEGAQFVTSDCPAVLAWEDDRFSRRPVGHGLKGTVLFCPLSSEVALLGSFDEVPPIHELSSGQVAAANVLVAQFADRQIFSRDDQARFNLDGQLVPVQKLIKALRD